ncbi:MAG TPA: aromatic amino acid lyase, partial [Puia sp.]
MQFKYGTDQLTLLKAIQLAEGRIKGILPDETRENVRKSQLQVAQIVSRNKTVYGINTGFGALANTKISEDDTRVLQQKILQSHSVGVGKPIDPFLVRLMMITKVNALCKGF